MLLPCQQSGGVLPRLDKTSSTLLLKQPNSLDVDTQDLRKTKSAENIQCCPRIIIDQVTTPQPSSAVRRDKHSENISRVFIICSHLICC